MVVRTIPRPPEPIPRALGDPDIILPPSIDDTLAFAHGVLQAVIDGRAKWREAGWPDDTSSRPIKTTMYNKIPSVTCITNYTALRRPIGARRRRSFSHKGRAEFGNGRGRRERDAPWTEVESSKGVTQRDVSYSVLC